MTNTNNIVEKCKKDLAVFDKISRRDTKLLFDLVEQQAIDVRKWNAMVVENATQQQRIAELEAENMRLNQLMDGMDEYQTNIEKTRPLAVEIIDLRKGSVIMADALGEANRRIAELEAENLGLQDDIEKYQLQISQILTWTGTALEDKE